MRVEALRAHAAHIEADVLLDLIASALRVVVENDGGDDLEILTADAHRLLASMHHAVRRQKQGNPAIADFRAQRHVLRPFGTEMYGNALAHRAQNELQRLA